MITPIVFYPNINMQDSHHTIQLCQDDVIKLQKEGERIHLSNSLFRIDEFEQHIKAGVLGIHISDIKKPSAYTKPKLNWLEDGVDCEALVARQGKWQNGKIRIKLSVEFIPEPSTEVLQPEAINSESPLDDIRQSLDQTGVTK